MPFVRLSEKSDPRRLGCHFGRHRWWYRARTLALARVSVPLTAGTPLALRAADGCALHLILVLPGASSAELLGRFILRTCTSVRIAS